MLQWIVLRRLDVSPGSLQERHLLSDRIIDLGADDNRDPLSFEPLCDSMSFAVAAESELGLHLQLARAVVIVVVVATNDSASAAAGYCFPTAALVVGQDGGPIDALGLVVHEGGVEGLQVDLEPQGPYNLPEERPSARAQVAVPLHEQLQGGHVARVPGVGELAEDDRLDEHGQVLGVHEIDLPGVLHVQVGHRHVWLRNDPRDGPHYLPKLLREGVPYLE